MKKIVIRADKQFSTISMCDAVGNEAVMGSMVIESRKH